MSVDPVEVLSLFPLPSSHRAARLQKQSAGWSGGAVWHVNAEGNDFALRLWPNAYPANRIRAVHAAQRHAWENGCRFIPQIIPAKNGSEQVTYDGALWELADWMPGDPAPRKDPTEEQLWEAAKTLAQWHRAFSPPELPTEISQLSSADVFTSFRSKRLIPSPALGRRLAEWRRLVPLVEYATPSRHSIEVDFLTERMRRLILGVRPSFDDLANVERRPFEMVLSLPDLHREHVLFSRGRVSGMIDLGGMTIDSPAFDIARYGSSFETEGASLRDLIRTMVGAYRDVRPFDESLVELIISIAHVSTAIGAFHWWEWLTRTNSIPPDRRESALLRWDELICRLERWQGEGM